MNILYLLNRFPTISEVFILNEITGLLELGHDVWVVSLYKPEQEITHDEVAAYNLIHRTTYLGHYPHGIFENMKYLLKILKKLFLDRILTISETLFLLKLCYKKDESRKVFFRKFIDYVSVILVVKEKKISHVHCHFAKENVNIAHIVRQVCGCPYTFTTHAHDIFINPDKRIRKWAESAQRVIAISEFNKKYMCSNLDISLDKIDIVACSVYVDKINPVRAYSVQPFRIVSLSRLVEKKGHLHLVAACRILKDKNVEFICEIHGAGPMEKQIRDCIKENGLEDKIKLGTALNHRAAIEFISTGSVFVLPCIRATNNDMDGIPNVLMESMALEIPTVSTRITGIPELIEHGVDGLIVSPEDSLALADAIAKIKNDVFFAEKIRKNSRKKIMERFDVRKNVRTLIEIFGN